MTHLYLSVNKYTAEQRISKQDWFLSLVAKSERLQTKSKYRNDLIKLKELLPRSTVAYFRALMALT